MNTFWRLGWVLGLLGLLGLLRPVEGWAQVPPRVSNTPISLLLKNNSLVEAFAQIEAKTPFRITYSSADINPQIRVTLRYHQATVEQVLLDLAKIGGLTFRQLNFSVNAARGYQPKATGIAVLITPKLPGSAHP